MKKDKAEKFIESWSNDRRAGKETYVNKRSAISAVAILIGISITKLYRGESVFFNLSNIILIFVFGYISARIGSSRMWKRNENKYSELLKDVKNKH